MEHVSQAIEPLGQMFATAGALGSVLSFVLAVYLEWGTIKSRVKGRAPLRDQLASQSNYETKPAPRLSVRGYPPAKTLEQSIAGLVGKLFLDLVKTMFAIFMAIVVSAEYLLFADYGLGADLPYQGLLIASLAVGAILGAYLRLRSWFFLLLIGIFSQAGILALNGWGLQDVLATVESLVGSSLLAGLY
jgi:hypothetical protein